MFLTTFLFLIKEAKAELHKNLFFSDCSISTCSSSAIELDHHNQKWPNYCYHCLEGEDQVIFLRKYSENDWEYVLTKQENYEGRVLLNIFPCFSPEVDSMGNLWTTWCFGKQVVQFERIGEGAWVYKQDFNGGYPQLQYRRIVFNQVFLSILNKIQIANGEEVLKSPEISQKSEKILKNIEDDEEQEESTDEPLGGEREKADVHTVNPVNVKVLYQECRNVEGDYSGRYFYQEYSESGGKIDYKKDSFGNFLINHLTLTRVPSSFLELSSLKTASGSIPCRTLDSELKTLVFEPDIYVPNMFWRKDLEDGQFVSYVRSSLIQDKFNGMYLIDEETGARLRNFI